MSTPKEDIHNMPHIGPSPFPTMDNIRVSQAGVYKLLLGLRPFKATGPDEIPAYILKEAAEHISPYLTIIYQKSLDTGIIPDDWRAANIVRLQKRRKTQSFLLSASLIDFNLLQTIGTYCSQHHHGSLGPPPDPL